MSLININIFVILTQWKHPGSSQTKEGKCIAKGIPIIYDEQENNDPSLAELFIIIILVYHNSFY